MAREQGEEGLRGKIAGGRASRLRAEQLQQLPRLLEQGAQAHGFAGAVWTTERVAVVIYQQFRVRYHPAHMSRLLKAIHSSVQQPIQRARKPRRTSHPDMERAALARVKKKPNKRVERSCSSMKQDCICCPWRSRTYAPVGQTPVLRVPLTHDHLEVERGHHSRRADLHADARVGLSC